MDVITALREQLVSNWWLLERCIEGLSPEQLWWRPPGTANPVADNYLHLVLNEDDVVQGVLQGKPPLASSLWADRTGLSASANVHGAGAHGSPAWSSWIQRVGVDWPAFARYARAVHEASDAYLLGLEPDDLDRRVDLSAFGLGVQSLNSALFNLVIAHASSHVGEIVALKGVQGLRGHPF